MPSKIYYLLRLLYGIGIILYVSFSKPMCSMSLALPQPAMIKKNVDTLSQKLNALAHNSLIRPFNGEIMISLKGKTILQQTIQCAKNIPSARKSGQMKYVIASITKQITAALILQAVSQGKLKLNDTAITYLTPEDVDDWTLPKYQATIHELLSHTSGYVDGQNDPVAPPGKCFNYASWSYAVLGHILANLYGIPFPELANQFFKKIGMTTAHAPKRAKVHVLRQTHPDLIQGFHCDENDNFVEANPEIGGNRGAAGSVLAKLQDLARWHHVLHQEGLLNPSLYQRMTTPYSQTENDVFGTIGYGYGLQIAETKAGIEYSHLGHIPGYQSMALYYPKVHLSIVVFINSDRLGQDDSTNANEHLRMIRHYLINFAESLK